MSPGQNPGFATDLANLIGFPAVETDTAVQDSAPGFILEYVLETVGDLAGGVLLGQFLLHFVFQPVFTGFPGSLVCVLFQQGNQAAIQDIIYFLI